MIVVIWVYRVWEPTCSMFVSSLADTEQRKQENLLKSLRRWLLPLLLLLLVGTDSFDSTLCS